MIKKYVSLCTGADCLDYFFQSGSLKVTGFLPDFSSGSVWRGQLQAMDDFSWSWSTLALVLALVLLHPFTMKLPGSVCECGDVMCSGAA